MTAKKVPDAKRKTDEGRYDALSFVPFRRSRHEIVEKVLNDLRNDLKELRKLTLDA